MTYYTKSTIIYAHMHIIYDFSNVNYYIRILYYANKTLNSRVVSILLYCRVRNKYAKQKLS